MKHIREWFLQKKVLASIFLLSGVFCWILAPSSTPTEESVSMDKNIPAGFQLVPIKVENDRALNSILDGFGHVDLYIGPRRIARNVKIVRGTHNPEEFSVLIPEEYVGHILDAHVPYRVVLRGHNSGGTRIETKQEIVKRGQPIAVEALNGETP